MVEKMNDYPFKYRKHLLNNAQRAPSENIEPAYAGRQGMMNIEVKTVLLKSEIGPKVQRFQEFLCP
jgi:hypothetical protein